jgi:hypothetical protein
MPCSRAWRGRWKIPQKWQSRICSFPLMNAAKWTVFTIATEGEDAHEA